MENKQTYEQEPLRLPDGTEVYPAEPEQSSNYVEVPTGKDAVRMVTKVRRSIADLPAPPKQMNAISVVCMYKLFGLEDHDIAIATQIPVEQVERIQMLDAFEELWNSAKHNIISADSEDIASIIQNGARTAAKRIITVSEKAQDPFAVVAASKDILDRQERREQQAKETDSNSLRIEVIRRDESERNPEMEFSDGDC